MATNLSAALRLAQTMLPSGFAGRVVLLTDGRSTVAGDQPVATAAGLRAAGVRVDAVPVGGPAGPDVRLDAVTLPPQARVGEDTSLAVSVWSDRTAAATLAVTRDGALLQSRAVTLDAGENRLVLALPAGVPGLHRYEVRVAAANPANDTVPQNDALGAFQTVLGPPGCSWSRRRPRTRRRWSTPSMPRAARRCARCPRPAYRRPRRAGPATPRFSWWTYRRRTWARRPWPRSRPTCARAAAW